MKKTFLHLLAAVLLLASCGTARVVPITGRKQHPQHSTPELLNSIIPMYRKHVGTYGDSNDKFHTAMFGRVCKRLIAAMEDYLRNNGYAHELSDYKWEYHLIKDPTPNAVCYPGGKMLMFEGMLKVLQNEDQMAAVMGHEIGHAIALHGSAGVSRDKLLGAILHGTLTVINESHMSDADKTTMSNLSQLGAELVSNKFSRKEEHEADHIGLVLMAMAGYNPHEAPKVWQRMIELWGDDTNCWLSTHPSHTKRKRWIEEKWMPEALKYYKPVKRTAHTKPAMAKKSNATQNRSTATRKATATKPAARKSTTANKAKTTTATRKPTTTGNRKTTSPARRKPSTTTRKK